MAGTLPSQDYAVAGRIKPQTVAAGATVQSDVVDMSLFSKLMAVVNIGDYAAAGGTVVIGLYGDTTAGGSFNTLIPGKSASVGAFDGLSNDDSVCVINLVAEELTALANVRYVRVKVTVTGQALPVGGELLAYGIYQPSSDYDNARVLQIVR